MLEIQETFEFEKYSDVIAKAGDKKLHITEALDKGNVTGFIAYSYADEEVIICDFEDNGDLYLCDGMVRSVLFKGCLKGLDKAYFDIDNEEKLKRLKSLLFVKDDSKTLDNMNEFMDKCKKCKGMQ